MEQEYRPFAASADVNDLFAALSVAQDSINLASKDSMNPHFNRSYADIASIISVIRPILTTNGLAFFQNVSTQDGSIGVETVITHKSGQWLSAGSVILPTAKTDPQGIGATLTYARRYSLAAAFVIGTEDDDGNTAQQSVQRPVSQPCHGAVVQELIRAFGGPKASGSKNRAANFLSANGVNEVGDSITDAVERLSKAKCDGLIAVLERMPTCAKPAEPKPEPKHEPVPVATRFSDNAPDRSNDVPQVQLPNGDVINDPFA